MSTQREWTTIREYDDILFDYYNGIARITINRERYRNAFTPTTTAEMSDALRICREEADIDVIVITGAGDKAFCSGGDQNVKGRGGYIGKDGVPRLSVLDVQKQIRSIPKPVIAAVNGFAIGGGHVLHVVCDLSIASENAIFGQTGPRVGSFDAGFGASYLARVVGQKKAREIWFLCRKYNAQEALDMGLVNKVVPLEQLEDEYVQWAEEMMQLSPLALRMIKAGLNELAKEIIGNSTSIFYKETDSLGHALGIDKFRLNRLRNNHGGKVFLQWLIYEKGFEKVIKDNVIAWFSKWQICLEDLFLYWIG